MKKIAVVLSGCGHLDGAEITESVSLMIALSQLGAEVSYFAPNMTIESKNHSTGKITIGDKRNILTESARITRGKSSPLNTLNAHHFDALIFVGGSGVAIHLSTWAFEGSKCHVLPEVSNAIDAFYSLKKPIGAICIAPVLLACTLGKNNISITIGNNKETIQEILKTGAFHADCPITGVIVDKKNKIVTTPAYMYEALPHEVFKGITNLANEIIELI